MGDRAAKDALYDGFAEVAKALASGRRAEMIDVLAQGERHVEELAADIGQSIANTSFHLRTLATAGLVSTRRDGNRIYYRLASARVADAWAAVRDVAVAHLEDLQTLAEDYLGDRAGVEEIDREELLRRLDDGDVILVDVRPRAEYAAGHITGARSIPHDELAGRLAELPRGVEVIAYCRGPFCVYADEAVRLLRSRRRRARRLRDGYPEWRRADLPVTEPPSATSSTPSVR